MSDLDSKKPISSPKPIYARRPSVSSTLESGSTPSSSRSDSPIKPLSGYGTGRRRSYELPRHRHHHRRHPHFDTLSPFPTQTSPSKSILSRTASVSTKASSQTANTSTSKSVKFATVSTTVHYPIIRGNSYNYLRHFDMESLDPDSKSVDINIDGMDLDDDPFANYRSRDAVVVVDDVFEVDEEDQGESLELSEARSDTPTPERVRERRERQDMTKRLMKEFITFARRSTSVVGTSGATAHVSRNNRFGIGHERGKTASAPPSPSPRRPTISSPYVLGAYPVTRPYGTVSAENPLSSSTLYNNDKVNNSWSSVHSFVSSSSNSIKSSRSRSRSHSESCIPSRSSESLRSTKTTGVMSLRSLESVVNVGRFKNWVGQRVGLTGT